MGHKPKEPKPGFFDKQILSKICPICKISVLEHHHQYPNKYYKCPQCGFTREIDNIKIDSIIGSVDFDKPDEEKD